MSDTKNETLAAILAEMRCDNPLANSLTASQLSAFLRYADRIEAAAERERAITDIMLAVKDQPLPHPDPDNAPPLFAAPGNAAAMRDALAVFVDSIQWLCDGDERGIFKKQFAPLLSEARAALAAPARNCDRYDVEDGVAACMQAIDAAWHEIDTIRATIGWLLAPAEGGAV